MAKHPGGRGRTSPTKHITIRVSLAPADKALLDSWVTPGKSRSEVVSRLIQAHAARPTAAPKFADVPLFAAPTATSPAPGFNPTPPRTGARELRAGWRVAQVSSHAQIIHELSQGGVLAFTGDAWMLTEQNGTRRIIGPSAVRDMLKLGVLEDAD